MDTSKNANTVYHAGPPLGVVAIVYAVLFIVGLLPVTTVGGKPYFPGPWETPEVIQTFFQARPNSVVLCAFFQFGAAIPLGIFTASAVSQLRFLGARVAGTFITLFGGFMTAFNLSSSALLLWTMVHPGIAGNSMLLNALYYFSYALGGPGFSVPTGLLIAGITIPSAFMKLLPKWMIVFGIIIAIMGELSWLNLVFPPALFLIPLTRFPGFIWLIIAGFKLPKSKLNGQ